MVFMDNIAVYIGFAGIIIPVSQCDLHPFAQDGDFPKIHPVFFCVLCQVEIYLRLF
ncbi:Uncharacterised protein [Mycobacteroides abscessus subsp. abscessus]|nr:Uncharacterised protein [Mycobacteroides abscessus subsp. abscessus]